MNEAFVIVLIGFAVLGIYFVIETLQRAFSKGMCRYTVVLYVPKDKEEKVDLNAEVIMLRNLIPKADIVCTSDNATTELLKKSWQKYGIPVVYADDLKSRIENAVYLQKSKGGV